MPLRLSYSQLYLSGLEMKDDLLYTLKSIILTDTALILYNPISKPQNYSSSFNVDEKYFHFHPANRTFHLQRGKISVGVSNLTSLPLKKHTSAKNFKMSGNVSKTSCF